MLTESLSRLDCNCQSKCVFSLPASCFWGIYNWFSFQIASHFVNSFLGEIFSFSVFPPFLLFTSHNSPFSPCCKGTIGHHCNTSKQWYWIWTGCPCQAFFFLSKQFSHRVTELKNEYEQSGPTKEYRSRLRQRQWRCSRCLSSQTSSSSLSSRLSIIRSNEIWKVIVLTFSFYLDNICGLGCPFHEVTEETRWLLELHNWIVGVGRGRSTATAHYYDMMEKMIIIMMDDEGGLGADGIDLWNVSGATRTATMRARGVSYWPTGGATTKHETNWWIWWMMNTQKQDDDDDLTRPRSTCSRSQLLLRPTSGRKHRPLW